MEMHQEPRTKMNNKQSKRNFQVHRTVRLIVGIGSHLFFIFFFFFFFFVFVVSKHSYSILAITHRNATFFFSFHLLSCIEHLLLTDYYFMMIIEHFKIEHGSPTSILSNRNGLSKRNEKEKSFFFGS